MGRQVAVIFAFLASAALSACGGGGGGGGGSANPPSTPIPGGGAVVPNFEVCDGSGQLCLGLDDLTLASGQETRFVVTAFDQGGRPMSGVSIELSDGTNTEVTGGDGATDSNGQLIGSVSGVFDGQSVIRAQAPSMNKEVFLRVTVRGGIPPTPPPGSTGTVVRPTFTQTPDPVDDVQTIFMELSPFAISSAAGGRVTVRAIVFDSNNEPVDNVNILFDFEPKVGTLRPITERTVSIIEPDGRELGGVAEIVIDIPAGEAPPGEVRVTAAVPGGIEGSASFSIVPGNAPRPVGTVLVEASDTRCGSDSGGSIIMRAVVFDADNRPLNGVNVLFLTDQGLGRFLPLVQTTEDVGNQGGVAQTTLQIPIGAPVRVDSMGGIIPYEYRARAAGIEGTAQVFIVPGTEPCDGNTVEGTGEPSSISLGANNTVIRTRGNGERELTQIRGIVRDSGNNEVVDAKVRFFLDESRSAAGTTLLPANSAGGFCSTTIETCASNAECPAGETCEIDPDNRFVSLTDQAGSAQITVRAGTEIGTITIGAEVVSGADAGETVPCSHPDDAGLRCIRATSVAITVTGGAPGRISATVNSVSVVNNDGTLTTTVAVFVTDNNGNTVADGTPVSISIGSFGVDSAVRDRISVVGFPVTNGPPPCDTSQFPPQQTVPVVPQPGTAITCVNFPSVLEGASFSLVVSTDGISTNEILVLPGIVDDLVVAPAPSRVVVTQEQPGVSLITAVVLNGQGDPVPNVELSFETDPGLGSFGAGAVPPWIIRSITDGNGVATATLSISAGSVAEGAVDVLVYGGGIGRFAAATTSVEFTATGVIPGGGGEPRSITFQQAVPSVIGVRGASRTSQSIVTFLVTDVQGEPVPGVAVNFFVGGVGGAMVDPALAVTNSDGLARTSVLAGTRASPLGVTASVDSDGNGTADLVARSQPINIVGGRPNADRISLSPEFLNIAGRARDGLTDILTGFVNDAFGNPVVEGTVVNFISNGGAVADQSVTDGSGIATASLISESPIPPNGIVSVLMTVIGEESFVDVDGDGVRGADEPFTDSPEPFIDTNGNGQFDPAVTEERFVDVNGNGQWDRAQSPGQWDSEALLFARRDVTFSGAPIVSVDQELLNVFFGEPVDLLVSLADADGNPVTSETSVSFLATRISGNVLQPNLAVLGLGEEGVIIVPDAQTFGAVEVGVNLFRVSVVVTEGNFPDVDDRQTYILELSTAFRGLTNNSTFDSPPAFNGNASTSLRVEARQPATPTPTLVPTSTPSRTPTATGVPTDTTTPMDTPTPTPTLQDTITATATFTPRPAAMAFVEADPTSVGVRGSGIAEQSVVTFRVTDPQAQPVAGIPVRFSVQSLGGEAVSPGEGVTGPDGTVSTVLTSGRRTSSVRVRAELVSDPTIFTQSGGVRIVGAPPAFDRFSLAAAFVNVAGGVTLGIEDTITAFLNDRFGNAAPEGTVVSFQSNASSVVNPTLSDSDGRANATLITEGGRFPPDGIVRVIGFTRGEEAFVDANGDGVYNLGETFSDVPEPFIDANGNNVYDPENPFETLVDVNGNGVWDSAQGPGVWDSNALIWRDIAITFSGNTILDIQPSGGYTIPDGGSQAFTLSLSDFLDNPIVGGSTVAITVSEGLELLGQPASFQLPDAQSFGNPIFGLNRFSFAVADAEPGVGDVNVNASVTVTVTSDPTTAAPGGNGSVSRQVIGVLLAAPTPTPEDTPTSTPVATSTPTSTSTATDTPTVTNTPTSTSTSTFTSTPTSTNTPTSTSTSTSTNTPVPTDTPTATNTATATDTPT